MKYLLIFLLFISCTNTKENLVTVAKKKDLFTSTQKYQILCWTIKRGEGYSKKSYLCSAGKQTVGYGFTNVRSVNNIHHADEIFKDIVFKLSLKVNKAYPHLTYLQKAAIISLLYNTGDLEKIKSSGFSKALLLKDNKTAIAKFKKWCRVITNKKVIKIKGLENRRNYEAKLLNDSFDMNDYLSLKEEIALIYLQNKTV